MRAQSKRFVLLHGPDVTTHLQHLSPGLTYFFSNIKLHVRVSATASVTFPFDGTQQEFARLYDAIADIDLDIAAYFGGTMGVVEFMTDDFASFRDRVGAKATQLGLKLVALDYIVSEKKA